MATTWNPADILNVTLSGGNLIATGNAGGQIAARAHGVSHQTSGLWYLEYANLLSAGGGGYGLAYLSDALSANAGGDYGVTQGGLLFTPGRSGDTLPGANTNGQTVGLAIDLTGHFLYATVDGINWFGLSSGGTPNPSTNSNGLPFGTNPTAGLFPICAMFSTPSHCTLNVGASAFAYTVPTGFTAWDSTPVPTNVYGTLIN